MRNVLGLLLAMVITACASAPKAPVAAGKPRWIYFNKTNFEKSKGVHALGFQSLQAIEAISGGKVVKELDKINGYVIESETEPPPIGGDWVVQRELTYHHMAEAPSADLFKICADGKPPVCGGTVVDPGPIGTPDTQIPYGITMIQAPEALKLVPNTNKILCILDTGISLTHHDLKGLVIKGQNFVGGSSYADDHGHGTHVAGTAVGIANNGGLLGVAQGKLLIGKVLNASGSGSTSGIGQGILWCGDNGASVINMSLGGPGRDPAIDQAIATVIAKGVSVVVAAGNSGGPITGSPAQTPGVIVATAIDSTYRPASFTSYGPEADFYAPGVNVVSADFRNDNGYATMSGTSMASPHVAGVVLIMKARGKTTPGCVNKGLPAQYGRCLINAAVTAQ